MTTDAAALHARVRLAAARRVSLGSARDDDTRIHALILAGGTALAALAHQLADGTITKAAFITQATARLSQTLQDAGELGLAAEGAEAGLDADSLNALLDDRADALDGFADAAADGGLSVAQIAQRALGWAGLGWTAYQLGRGDGAQADGRTVCDWELDAGAQHCDDPDGQDCPGFAEGSPYTEDTLPAYPADGTTPCAGNCRCALTWRAPAESEDA